MNLQEIRERIDELDREILSLLNERMELALRTGRLKEAVRDEAREARVLEQVGRYADNHHNLLGGDFVKALYGEIMKESRRIQEKREEVFE
jgi:chorismate mutase